MAKKNASVVKEDNDVAEAEEALPPAGRKRGRTKDGAAAESGAPAKTKKRGKNPETEKTAGPATTSGKTSKAVAGKKRSVKGQATEEERGEDPVVQEEAPAPGSPQKEESVQVAKAESKKKKEETAAPAMKSSKAKKAVAAEPPGDAQDQEPEVAVTKRKKSKAVKGSKKPATKTSEAIEDPTGETAVSSAATKGEAPPAAARISRRTAARSAAEYPKVAETGTELKASKTPKSAKRKVEEGEGKENDAPRPKKRVKVEKEVPALERIFHPSHGKVKGFVYVTGTGDCGQFGMGEDIIEALRPKQSPVLDALVVQVAAGGMHSVALGADGAVYTTGVNDEGALGRKTGGELWQKSELLPEGGVTETETWSRVDVPTVHGPVVQVSAGDSHTVALTAQGFLYGWGTYRDSTGVFGFSPKEHIALLPTLVYSPKSLDE
eukprot:jgi/Botrbrau1/10003/Bobra.0012s0092.1